MGLLGVSYFKFGNHFDRWQKHQSQRRSPFIQREHKNVEVPPLHEPTESLTQVVLLLREDLRDRRRLWYELWGLRHPREQMEFYLQLQQFAGQFAILLLICHCCGWRRRAGHHYAAGAGLGWRTARRHAELGHGRRGKSGWPRLWRWHLKRTHNKKRMRIEDLACRNKKIQN